MIGIVMILYSGAFIHIPSKTMTKRINYEFIQFTTMFRSGFYVAFKRFLLGKTLINCIFPGKICGKL